jgi:anti-anti-sigma regulatory factor
MIYLVPLNDGTVVTIYGNIDTKSAIEIAKNIKK